MQVKPLGNRVLVKQSSMEEVTKSGIVLPDTADKEKKHRVKLWPWVMVRRSAN